MYSITTINDTAFYSHHKMLKYFKIGVSENNITSIDNLARYYMGINEYTLTKKYFKIGIFYTDSNSMCRVI